MQFFLTPDVIFVVYDHFMCKVFLEGRRVEELRQKVAAEAGIFLINFDVHVLPALYTKLCIPSDLITRDNQTFHAIFNKIQKMST